MLDNNTQCWIQVSAGKGPEECAFAVNKITQLILREAKQYGLDAQLTESVFGNKPNTCISTLISLKGNSINAFIARWKGSIQWICQSIYRPKHKRKNWYVGVEIVGLPKQDNQLFNKKDVIFEAIRATGPGGQHVNTTNSAVRAIHKPTGITTIVREERSQHMNKRLALAKLASMLEHRKHDYIANQHYSRWQKQSQLERGNPTRVFIGMEFRERL